MLPRLIFALQLLILAGCATTGGAPDVADPVPAIADSDLEIHSSTATIDEHLYVPKPKPRPAPVVTEEPIEHSNVWARVVDQFALPDCTQYEQAIQWAEWYAARPDYMARIVKRAQPWIYYIADEIETRGLPGELALLPIVESAYDPFAYSSGNALGAWQFIASTGRNYGLQQNWWYEGRRDVWASTDAAFRYLNDMAVMFDGDWLLALAGYNSGEGRVARQVKKNRRAGKPADFWNLRLPRETRGYVPKLLGLACLFQHPERFDFTLPETANEQVVAAVDIGRQADLVLVAQMAGVPIDVMFTLNPGYNRWATSPEGPFQVILPVDNAELLLASLGKIDASALMRWDQVVVQSGDTLSHISARHNVPVSVLRTSNNLDTDLIRVGQKLRLPRDDQTMIDPYYTQASMELQNLQSGLISTKRVTHRVRSGENLSVIANRYRVSVADLRRWNKISDPRKLRAGTTITVYQSPKQLPAPTSGTIRHVVQHGDSLWKIARKYNVKVDDIRNWNGMNGETVLHPGQAIRIEL